MTSKPHPANVPGPFYVEDGCCLSCGVWETEAPGLLAWLEDSDLPHCFVARQPETDAEFRQMMAAMQINEVQCLRVRSCKPEWARELCRNRLGAQIDDDQIRIEAERTMRPKGLFQPSVLYGGNEREIFARKAHQFTPRGIKIASSCRGENMPAELLPIVKAAANTASSVPNAVYKPLNEAIGNTLADAWQGIVGDRVAAWRVRNAAEISRKLQEKLSVSGLGINTSRVS